MDTIPISLPQLLALTYGDDSQFHNRCWLGIFTLANGYCRVIDKALAEEIFARDRAEQLTHIEVYETRTYTQPLFDRFPESYKPRLVAPTIYTLWSAPAWLESNERVRLTRAKCVALHIAVTNRDICDHIARVAAIQIAGKDTEHSKLAIVGLKAQAAYVDYNVEKFLDYLDLLAKPLKDLVTGEPIELTSKHRSEFLTTNNNEHNELQQQTSN